MSRTSMRALGGRAWLPACAALLAALALAPAAAAQPLTWLAPITLENSGGTQAAQAIACSSPSRCTSVDANGQQVTFNPTTGASTGSSSIDLRGTVSSVACPSSTQCTAVDNLGNQVTFDPATGAVVGGGLQSAGGANPLTSVACRSATECSAVDNQGDQVTFNATTGAPISASKIDGTHDLTSVSCNGYCLAVDANGNAVSYEPANGNIDTAATNIDTHALTSISCTPTLCVAVDTNGQEISLDPAALSGPTHPIDGTTALTSVSCLPDASHCTAVDGQGNEITFIPSSGAVTSESGSVPGPQSVDGINRLSGVACPATTSTQCTAIDTHGNEVSFTPATGAPIGGGLHSVAPTALASVSCPATTQCTAVDSGGRAITFDPTTRAVTGQDGHGNVGPSIVDSTGNRLNSVSCPTTTQCTAIDTGSFEVTFNPRNGRLNAAGGSNKLENGQSLESVSCPDVLQCTAVDAGGQQVTFNPQLAAPNSINNVSPNPVDGTPDHLLEAVVCLTDHACVAVDHGGAEVSFDPTSVNAGTPTEIETGQHPTALSCASATLCTAVDGSGQAITFDPTTVAASQTDTAGPGSVDPTGGLNGVSCPSTSLCVAVDSHGNSTQFAPATLAGGVLERVAQAAALQAVSCPASYECATVDAGGNGFAGFLPPADSALPTITGTPQQGQTLTEQHGTFANYPASGYAVQWEDCDDSGCSPIPGATGTTYLAQPSDVGEMIAVQETATNLGGDSQPATSLRTSGVLPLAPANVGPPAIVGTVAQGQMLSEHHGQWANDPTGYTVQWMSCDGNGLGCTAIAGANGQTYEPQDSDVGRTLVVQETAGNAGGSSPPVSSTASGTVASARQADVKAVTDAESSLTYRSAVLHGVLYTQGAPATWQFRYGTTTALGSGTPVQTVADGDPNEIGVQAALAGLRPATTYFGQLVITVSAGPYRTAVQGLGNIVRFTTPLVGSLHLHSTQVPVSGHRAAVGLDCRAPVRCAVRLNITAGHWVGAGSHRHLLTVRCASANTALTAHRSRQVGVSLSSACLALIRDARHQVLDASLAARSTSGQHGFTHSIQFRG